MAARPAKMVARLISQANLDSSPPDKWTKMEINGQKMVL